MRKVIKLLLILLTFYLGINYLAISQLKLIHPKGGEVIKPRKMLYIQWEGTEIEQGHKVEFSSDLGENWVVLDSNVTGHEYRWLVPNIEMNNCLIRVSQKEYEYLEVDNKRRFGGSKDDILVKTLLCNDGNYLLAGYTFSDDGDILSKNDSSDIWLLKVNPKGSVMWSKTFGGSSLDVLTNVIQDKNGDFIAIGYSSSKDGDFSEVSENTPAPIILKVDNNGEKVWTKVLNKELSYLYGVTLFDDRSFVTAGMVFIRESGRADYNFLIVKIDPNGEMIWETHTGLNGYDLGRTIKKTNDNGLVLTGYSSEKLGDYSIATIKMDKDGVVEWESYRGSEYYDYGLDVIQTKDGGFATIGNASGQNGDVTKGRGSYEALTIKYSPDGTVEWINTFTTEYGDVFYSIDQIKNDNYLISGNLMTTSQDTNITNVKSFVYKLSSKGNLIWTKYLDTNSYSSILSQVNIDNVNFIFSGTITDYEENTANSNTDFYLINAHLYDYKAQSVTTNPAFSVSKPTFTNVDEVNLESPLFKVYNNTNFSEVSIEILNPNLFNKTIYIFDYMGKLISEVGIDNNIIKINTNIFKNGIYYINISSENNTQTESFEVVR